MGVPKFYRWISERYPCLSEVVKEHQIPEFDNLYLDMNGIIHQCSHPNDEDVHFRISEEKIFADIFHYLEVLFRIIKPRKVFFMAVDGVAPRAKMNQQRGRRFRSAKEAEDKIKKALEKGEVLPSEARFDSNCITPGTDFMARLQEQLKYFVNSKLSTDNAWKGVNVYLSGHETPGEGEHKIMEFIRSENAKPGHNPNTRHCLYGLDADLMMLGLTSHEPHFSLLREEVRFGGKKNQKRITAPEETTFHLLHLSLFREYIDYEFSEVKNKISFEYDLERIIDDWILMGFLVGNDFIPHLPHLHINQDALPLLYRTYISVLPTLGGYLNENGHLNLGNFEKYLEKLSEFDREHFNEVFVDLKWFESKVGNKYLNEAAGLAAEEAHCKDTRKKDLEDSLRLTTLDDGKDRAPGRGFEEDGEEEDMFEAEFRQYKRTYYMTKMGVEQLLGVLPAASKDLLPQSYRHLMTSENSSIIEYYPLDFKTDLNGKQQEWEAVVLIPFIDERCLLAAMEPYNDHMTKAEKARNRHTDHVARSVNSSQLYFLGFPTLQHIRHKFYKKKHGVVVFQQSSRGENMILEIRPSKEDPTCGDVASLVLGCTVFVNWPHLEEARVVAVSDGESKFFLEEPAGVQKLYDRDSPPPTKVTYLSDKEQKDWLKDVQGITEHFSKRKGIIVNETGVVLYAQLLAGRKYVPGQNRQVQESGDVIKEGRVWVVFTVPCEPPMEALIQNQHKYCVKYSPGYVLASRLGVTSYLVSRFSGSIFVGRGSKKNPHGEQKANVGLNLKFNKKNEEVPGYTKRTQKEWLYSDAVEELMAEYLDRFSEVFDLVSRNSHDDVFYEDDIWPGEDENGAEKVKEITSWLKTHPVADIARASCDLQILDKAIVERIEEEVEKAKVKKSSDKVRVTVKPHLLFRPLEQQHGVVPDPDAEYHLFDRVVNVRESFSAEVLYEVVFDEEFAGGLTIRCAVGRGYRLPPCALINLSHGGRVEQGFHKLTAIVKPQPASSHQHNKGQLVGLNHSPRSPFISTQGKDEEFSNVWQSLQSSGMPQKPPAHWQQNNSGKSAWGTGSPGQEGQFQGQQGRNQPQSQQQHPPKPGPAGSIRLLKRNEDVNSLFPAQNATKKQTEFEELIANLKISKGNEPTPPPPAKEPTSQSEEPLPPQSFAMKGTLALKEMLNIGSTPDSTSPASFNTQQQNRRRPTKKLAARMGDSVLPTAPAAAVPPLQAPQPSSMGLLVCQVKLSSGLLVHGPQCQSENEAKEKAALFALQRLNSVGSGFPLPPPLFSGVGQIRGPPMRPIPNVFGQSGGLLMPPQGYGPLHWGLPLPPHQGQPFYGGTFPGARPQAPSVPIGSHNQFVPLQVTKKRVSSGKKPQEFYNTAHMARNQAPGSEPLSHFQPPLSPAPSTPPKNAQWAGTPSTPQTPRQNPSGQGNTPGSASKRKHRKLAVNFEAAKVQE
ncbi:unnamed protein product [Coregonus sp. 'balchen']|nr:unnamed protein product [Coregonus sp. 'balchen']